MRLSRFILVTLFTAVATNSLAQTPPTSPNTKLSDAAFQTLAESCGANVPVSTLEAIARTESALHPYALGINRPHQLAHRQGWNRGTSLCFVFNAAMESHWSGDMPTHTIRTIE